MKGITGNPVLDAYQRGGVSKVGAAKAVEPGNGAAPSTTTSPSANSAAVEVSISSQARDLAANASAPVNYGKVESVKSQLEQGTFKIDSHLVAQRLLSALG